MLRFLAGVQEEIAQAVAYYDSRSPGRADEFLDALTDAYDEVEAHPFRNPRVDVRGLKSDYHYYLLPRFPYQLVYRIRADLIEVVAVAHTSRRQGYWRKRGT